MTARDGELGCFSEVTTETLLALPTGASMVRNVMLAVHGVYVAWAERDLSILPAQAGEVATAVGAEETTIDSATTATATSSAEDADSSSSSTPTSEQSRSPSPPAFISASITAGEEATSITTTLSGMTTESTTTRPSKLQMTDLAGGEMASVTQYTRSSTPPDPPIANASPSITDQQAQALPSSTIAGISIGAAAGVLILASLIAIAVLARRRRLRRRPKS
jgi:hypothetical protein